MLKRKLESNKENERPEAEGIKKSKVESESNDLIIIDDDDQPLKTAKPKTSVHHKQGAAQVQESGGDSNEAKFKSINAILMKIEKSGDYCFDGEAKELPAHPGLEIEGFGLVSLPLTDPQASELIKQCSQAPFGKNYDTIVDTNVRDSFELEPGRVRIRNPHWNAKLNELLVRIAKALGCQAEIEAKMYKLLVYKKGGHFAKHRDTEKEKKMFGTLVIQLPSYHKGGELVVYENNGETKKVIDFGQKDGNSEFSVYFAAHFADLEHELLEVKEGYRVALVYSLCWADEGNGQVISNGAIIDELQQTLSSLDNTKEYKLGLLLDHQYTQQSLQTSGLKALKGIDNDRFHLLARANNRLAADQQISFYMCNARLTIDAYDINEYKSSRYNEKEEDGYYEWEENERKLVISQWWDENGRECFKHAPVNLQFFTQVFDPSSKKDNCVDLNDYRAWGKHISKNFEGYSGNAGATKLTKYSKYLLVLWPKKNDFAMTLDRDAGKVIDSVFQSVVIEKKPVDDIASRLVNNLVKNIESESSKIDADQFIKLIRLHQQVDLFVKKQKHEALNGSQIVELMEILEEYEQIDLIKYVLNVEKFNRTSETNEIIRAMQMIIKYNIPDLVKLFLAKQRFVLTDNVLLIQLAKMISHFGFETMKKFIIVFKKPSIEKLIKNCQRVEVFHKENFTDLALNWFNTYVLPFLNDEKELKQFVKDAKTNPFGIKPKSRYSYYAKPSVSDSEDEVEDKSITPNKSQAAPKNHVLIELIKFVMQLPTMFPDHAESALESLKVAIMKHMNVEDSACNFISEFDREKSTFQACPQIREIFETRKQWLETKLRNRPAEFTWHMPQACLQHSHGLVEKFLKSNQESMVYRAFSKVKDLRSFITNYSGKGFCLTDFANRSCLERGYSVNMVEQAGKTVLITKTRQWFDEKSKIYEIYSKELDTINSFLSNS